MLSIWTKLLITVVAVVFPVWFGTRLGLRFKKKLTPEVDLSAIGSVVAAALGLLAFMLAFTFQLTADRFETRKELLRNEIVAIKTTYLRAALLKVEHKVPIRRLLVEYVDLHVLMGTPQKKTEIPKVVQQAKQIQDSLWMYTLALAEEDRSSETYSLFTSSVNDLIGLFDKRVVLGLYTRIPELVFWILYIITAIAMLILGYQFGVSGKGNMILIVLLAIIFTAVMLLIYSLDDAQAGIIFANHQMVRDLKTEINSLP